MPGRHFTESLYGPLAQVLAERERRRVHDERVAVAQGADGQVNDRGVDLDVGDEAQCLATDVDVGVDEGESPVVGRENRVARRAAKRQDPQSGPLGDQARAQHAGEVGGGGEARAQQGLLGALR